MSGGNFASSSVAYFDNLTPDEFWELWEVHQECINEVNKKMKKSARR